MKRWAPVVAAAAAIALQVGDAGGASPRVHVALLISTGTSQTVDNDLRRSFLHAVKRFGVEGMVAYLPPSGVATGVLTDLAEQRYEAILLGASVDPKYVGPVAARFPATKFLMSVLPYATLGRKLPNVQGIVDHTEQPSYLAGYLAASMARRSPGRDVVSTIGGYKFPIVDAFVAGFQSGARRADPAAVTVNAYAQSFDDPSKCSSVATAQIAGGSKVVFPVAGACGLGGLEAARSRGAWAVGVDKDRSSLGRFVLTSVLTNVDVFAVGAIRALAAGRLETGGDTVMTIANGGVGLGKLSPDVPAAIRRKLDSLKTEILAGRIRVPSTIS